MSDSILKDRLQDSTLFNLLADQLEFPHNHEEVAWSHFLAQHVGKPNTEGFVRSFYPPINILDKALNDLYTLRWLNTAVGLQLDGIGSIVGLPRTIAGSRYLPFFGFLTQISGRSFGVARIRHKREPYATNSILGDEEYRMAIYLKIALNNGHGTAEELIHAFNTSLRVTRTNIQDIGNANARVYINDFIMDNDPRSQLLEYMIPRAGGVKLWPTYVNVDRTFGFINQNMGYFGFYIGILARGPGSNIPSIDVPFSIWDRDESIWDGGESIWDQKGVPG
jgi:Protein of unknown function (DUF2612)